MTCVDHHAALAKEVAVSNYNSRVWGAAWHQLGLPLVLSKGHILPATRHKETDCHNGTIGDAVDGDGTCLGLDEVAHEEARTRVHGALDQEIESEEDTGSSSYDLERGEKKDIDSETGSMEAGDSHVKMEAVVLVAHKPSMMRAQRSVKEPGAYPIKKGCIVPEDNKVSSHAMASMLIIHEISCMEL